jgi:hypothetical protein
MSATTTRSTSAPAGDAVATVECLIVMIDELLSVVAEENRILARGLPASLSPQTARKQELAGRFERWVKDVSACPVSIRSCDPNLQHALTDRIGRLRSGMDENIQRLRAAMEASRRRIDAVMQAIRGEIASASPYGANARVQDSRVRPSYCNFSVRA